MDIESSERGVHISLSSEEAVRLGVALAEGCLALSPAEYFIRTGLSAPQVREIAKMLTETAEMANAATLPLEAGVEEVENPRRPRPT